MSLDNRPENPIPQPQAEEIFDFADAPSEVVPTLETFNPSAILEEILIEKLREIGDFYDKIG